MGGGIPRGSSVLLETDEKTSTPEHYLLVAPIAANFATQGRGVLVLSSTLVDYEIVRRLASSYGLSEEVFQDQVVLLAHGGDLHPGEAQPNVVQLKGVDALEDFRSTIEAVNWLKRGKDQPLLASVSLETVTIMYDEAQCRRLGCRRIIRKTKQVAITVARKAWPGQFVSQA